MAASRAVRSELTDPALLARVTFHRIGTRKSHP
jgi:hypothetical protein